MATQNLDRRAFLLRAAQVGLAVATAPALIGLVGCSKPAKTPTCTDTSGLSMEQLNNRKSFVYVDVSNKAGEECSNCQFYTLPKAGAFCGGCSLFAGPVSPKGHCNSWAAKQV